MAYLPNSRWSDVPGTRWLRADLHLHTIDDAPRKLPAGITGEKNDPVVLDAYARRYLDSAIEQGIEVLGLTPHSACIESGVSATIVIRDLWLKGRRHFDGRPYRDLIFAVYPGIEPNFIEGSKGLHLLFLFDPMVQKDGFLDACSAIMGGRPAYRRVLEDGDDPTGGGPIRKLHNLERSPIRPEGAFNILDDPKSVGPGYWVCIAAHPGQDNGIFRRSADDMVTLVGERLLAYEICRKRSAESDLAAESKLKHVWKKGRTLLHSSDANDLPDPGSVPKDRELGHRFTLLKLAEPTIGALRQALLARDSRVRLPFVEDTSGSLIVRSDLPEACPVHRPWIREVSVRSGVSFHQDQRFRFSPDLTCVIGGSMTGKSTLLDGIRVLLQGDADLPPVSTPLGKDVRARASQRFLTGSTVVDIDSPAGDVSLPIEKRFRFRFYAQTELESLSGDHAGIERLLFHLAPGGAAPFLAIRDELGELDAKLKGSIQEINQLGEKIGEADQKLKQAGIAREEMQRFADAGANELSPLQQDATRTDALHEWMKSRLEDVKGLEKQISAPPISPLSSAELAALLPTGEQFDALAKLVGILTSNLSDLAFTTKIAAEDAAARVRQKTAEVQQALIQGGGRATDLNQFESNARAAQHHDSHKTAIHDLKIKRQTLVDRFKEHARLRDELTLTLRHKMIEICDRISERYHGRIKVEVVQDGDRSQIQSWVQTLKNPGITRWWNDVGNVRATGGHLSQMIDLLQPGREGGPDDFAARQIAREMGMSDTVATAMLERLRSPQQRLDARALRTPDSYLIQWVENDEPRPLDQLSGGRKLAVLLSLLLDADDPTPLIIDQPEDQLDNRFLNDTIIPALHRLKGRRQVIFATHSANLVVNGDADQVIALEATSQAARIVAQGAIEDPKIRKAILQTLDGGEEAFRLRRAKYGF